MAADPPDPNRIIENITLWLSVEVGQEVKAVLASSLFFVFVCTM